MYWLNFIQLDARISESRSGACFTFYCSRHAAHTLSRVWNSKPSLLPACFRKCSLEQRPQAADAATPLALREVPGPRGVLSARTDLCTSLVCPSFLRVYPLSRQNWSTEVKNSLGKVTQGCGQEAERAGGQQGGLTWAVVRPDDESSKDKRTDFVT